MTPGQKRFLSLLAIGIILIGLVAGSVIWRRTVLLQEFIVEGTRELTDKQIIAASMVKTGKKIQDIDPTVIQTRIGRLPWVESVVVMHEFPSALRIRVTERKPVARVYGAWDGYIDGSGHGMPLSGHQLFDLPLIGEIKKTDFDTTYGRARNKLIRQLAAVLDKGKQELPTLYYQVSDFRLPDGKQPFRVYTVAGNVPVYLQETRLPEQLATLRAFWNQVVSITGTEQFEYIDLRHAGVITTRERG